MEEEFREGVRIVGRSNKKDAELSNVILEVNTAIKSKLCEGARVYIEWGTHKIKEYRSALRCYKCLPFGHMMCDCSMKERLCQRCSEGGHLAKDCKSESKCRNCKIIGRKHTHSIMSAECPEYVQVYERERIRVENG